MGRFMMKARQRVISKSQTRLTTTWVKSDLCGDDFLTCKNCKDKGIKIRRAYRKDYCEMWEYCPKCGAKMQGGADMRGGAEL